MNNAQKFVGSLVGQSITFKPVEKGKDRPVQTILFGEQCELPISSGGTVPAFNVTLTFAGKRGVIQTQRQISTARALEYVAQAAEQADQNYEEVVYVAPEPKEKPVKEPKVKAEKVVKEKAKTKKQLREEAEAAALAEQEANGEGDGAGYDFQEEYPEDPFAEEAGDDFEEN